jgi:hypothetical protein
VREARLLHRDIEDLQSSIKAFEVTAHLRAQKQLPAIYKLYAQFVQLEAAAEGLGLSQRPSTRPVTSISLTSSQAPTRPITASANDDWSDWGDSRPTTNPRSRLATPPSRPRTGHSAVQLSQSLSLSQLHSADNSVPLNSAANITEELRVEVSLCGHISWF